MVHLCPTLSSLAMPLFACVRLQWVILSYLLEISNFSFTCNQEEETMNHESPAFKLSSAAAFLNCSYCSLLAGGEGGLFPSLPEVCEFPSLFFRLWDDTMEPSLELAKQLQIVQTSTVCLQEKNKRIYNKYKRRFDNSKSKAITGMNGTGNYHGVSLLWM